MQYFEQSNENMEVELQLIIMLLSFYNTRHLAYSRSWLQEEEDKRVDKPLKERVLGSMHNYIIMSNSRKDFPHRLTPVIIFTRPFPRPAISSSKYFLRSNIILEYYFWYWYHILHRKNSVFISKYSINNRKTAFIK